MLSGLCSRWTACSGRWTWPQPTGSYSTKALEPFIAACAVPLLIVGEFGLWRSVMRRVVLVDQPAEHGPAAETHREIDDLISVVVRCQLLSTLVRPMVVVTALEVTKNPSQVRPPDDEQMIQAFTAHGGDEALGVGVRPRRLDRSLDHAQAGRAQNPVEPVCRAKMRSRSNAWGFEARAVGQDGGLWSLGCSI